MYCRKSFPVKLCSKWNHIHNIPNRCLRLLGTYGNKEINRRFSLIKAVLLLFFLRMHFLDEVPKPYRRSSFPIVFFCFWRKIVKKYFFDQEFFFYKVTPQDLKQPQNKLRKNMKTDDLLAFSNIFPCFKHTENCFVGTPQKTKKFCETSR